MTHSNQSPAVNHLAKFIAEEFVIGKGGCVQIGAFLKAYEWWTSARGVINRRLTPVELLDRVAQDFRIEPGKVRFTVDGEERFIYGLANIRFRNDPSLSWRLRYRAAPREQPREPTPDDTRSDQERRRAYYIANRERILAKRRERKSR